MTVNRGGNKGFTLLELSVSMLILSLILITVFSSKNVITKYEKRQDTEDRIKTIEDAISDYFLKNRHVPSPASLTMTPDVDANFGKAGYGFSDGTLTYGAVPVRDLNLSDETAFDAWGNSIDYVVYNGYINQFETTPKDTASITVMANGISGISVTTNAVYVLISHGGKARGAYRQGNQIDFIKYDLESSTSVDSYVSEFDNHYDGSFGNIFVESLDSEFFDDIVKFRTKTELIARSSYIDFGCLTDEAGEYEDDNNTIGWDTGVLAIYGEMIAAAAACDVDANTYSANPDASSRPVRVCGDYGQWSNVIYECFVGCTATGVELPFPENSYRHGECPETGQIGYIYYVCPEGGGALSADVDNTFCNSIESSSGG